MDASTTAIVRIAEASVAENLGMCAVAADVGASLIAGEYDTIVAIGLLAEIKAHVARGGVAIVNVLIAGTTYMEMFQPGAYYLFPPDELERSFGGWTIELARRDSFDAPGGTKKAFSTVVARRP